MPFDERFAFGMGMAVGIQVSSGDTDGITEMFIPGVLIRQANIDQHRVVVVQVVVDGELYEMELNLHDEAFEDKTITGRPKRKLEQ